MSKITISTIRQTINECPKVVGELLEIAFNNDDAIMFKMLIEGEMERKKHFEQRVKDVHEKQMVESGS